MIRSESVIVALFGAVVGIVIGTGLGIALAVSLRNNGVASLSVPLASLIAFLVLSALLGWARPRGRPGAPPGSTCWPRSRSSDSRRAGDRTPWCP